LALGIACQADRLVFLTDSGGLLGKDGQRIDTVHPDDAQHLIDEKVITGGMIVKAQACIRALNAGVGSVDIVKGIDHFLTGNPAQGTVFLL
jgi:acetylglutamate kinase